MPSEKPVLFLFCALTEASFAMQFQPGESDRYVQNSELDKLYIRNLARLRMYTYTVQKAGSDASHHPSRNHRRLDEPVKRTQTKRKIAYKSSDSYPKKCHGSEVLDFVACGERYKTF